MATAVRPLKANHAVVFVHDLICISRKNGFWVDVKDGVLVVRRSEGDETGYETREDGINQTLLLALLREALSKDDSVSPEAIDDDNNPDGTRFADALLLNNSR